MFHVNGPGSDALGNLLIVDGVNYAYSDLPKGFTWDIGSTHSFKWMDVVNAGIGKQYVWTSTSGLSSHLEDSINVPSGGGNVTATYSTKYYLTMLTNPSGGGTVSPCSGWYCEGSSVEIEVTPKPGYRFAGWNGSGSGSYTGLNNPANVTVNGPIVETAKLEAFDFTFSLASGNGTLQQGEVSTIIVNVTLLSGSPLPLSLSASDLPNGVSISFNPSLNSPPFTSSLEIRIADNTPAGTYAIKIVGRSDNLTRIATYILTVKALEIPVQDALIPILILGFATFLILAIRRVKHR
ncbi:MAG: InlB B-repeat-containing protein [Thermoproteota archaeon]